MNHLQVITSAVLFIVVGGVVVGLTGRGMISSRNWVITKPPLRVRVRRFFLWLAFVGVGLVGLLVVVTALASGGG